MRLSVRSAGRLPAPPNARLRSSYTYGEPPPIPPYSAEQRSSPFACLLRWFSSCMEIIRMECIYSVGRLVEEALDALSEVSFGHPCRT